jgi:hypothetical protein
MTDREKIIEIVRKHFREMPDDEACQFRKEDYELPVDESKLQNPIDYFPAQK